MPDAQQTRQPLNQRISFRVSRLHNRLNAQAARILRETAGISLSQWRILVMIDADGGQTTAGEISRRTQTDKALVSRTIKSLVRGGFVHVGISRSDARRHEIRFTPHGQQTFERAMPHMLARQTMLAEALGPGELGPFLDALQRIEAALTPASDASGMDEAP